MWDSLISCICIPIPVDGPIYNLYLVFQTYACHHILVSVVMYVWLQCNIWYLLPAHDLLHATGSTLYLRSCYLVKSYFVASKWLVSPDLLHAI